MESLEEYASAVEFRTVPLPSGTTACVKEFRIKFPPADPARLPDGVLARPYAIKPLVSVDGRAMFGELAIVRWLEKDGWCAVWVDTFNRKFWRYMPHDSQPIELPPPAKKKYSDIVKMNGDDAGGFFDVMAWRVEQYRFVEYKGRGDRPNANESRWIEAALKAGVGQQELAFVLNEDF